MKNIILLFFLLLIFFSCTTRKFSFQENTIITNEVIERFKSAIPENSKIKDLEEKNINYIIYHRYYVGGVPTILKISNSCSSCVEKKSYFLIWKENNVEHIQKFDNCGSFFSVPLKNDNITTLAFENFDLIASERVKIYQTDENTFSTINHSGFTEMILKKGKITAYNDFNHYNLSSDSDNKNINSAFNNNLKTVVLDQNIYDQIKILDSLNSFKRDFTKCKNN